MRIPLCLLLLLCAAGAPAAQLDTKLAYEVRGVPFREALAYVSSAAGIQIEVDPRVPDVPITLNVREVSAGALLRLLVRQAAALHPGIAHRTRGEVQQIILVPVEMLPREDVTVVTADARLSRKATLQLDDAPLGEALKRLLEGTGVRHELAAGVPELRVDVNLDNKPVLEGLRQVMEDAFRQAPELRLYRDQGVYRFEMEGREAPSPVLRAALTQRNVNLRLRAVPFREVINRIFTSSGLQYSVHPRLPNPDITMEAQGVSMEEALRRLVNTAGARIRGLKIGYDGDIVIFEARGPAARPAR